jgi:transcriptional regulator with XRE-family HTH domain
VAESLAMTRKKNEKELLKAFGEAVKRHREDSGLSQEELSFLCGLHRTYISDIERGARNPSIIATYKISEGLGCSWDKLFMI